MEHVDSAEKEASEVLHSLLSVERVEKTAIKTLTSDDSFNNDDNNSEGQWNTQVSNSDIIYTSNGSNGQYLQTIDDDQVIWEEQVQVEQDTSSEQLTTIYETEAIDDEEDEDEEVEITEVEKIVQPKPAPRRIKLKSPLKKKKKLPNEEPREQFYDNSNPTKLETSASQVKDRFKRGCECQDESCFRGLNPETVYKHRLNIAELTKGEHDMYLMGVTMACLANPDTTVRHKERRRLRAQYVYQGRRVCLDAFLYLENCTHYQLKRIRKHVMTHGVAPRVHGNHGKKPHNTFPLDIYRHATEFLKQYIEQHTGAVGICNSRQPIQLPGDITCKHLHDAYKEYGHILEPGVKLMGKSTFRHFMKEQFPHVKFSKMEPKATTQPNPSPVSSSQAHVQIQSQAQATVPQTTVTALPIPHQQLQAIPVATDGQNIQIQKCVITNEVQQVIPFVMTPNDNGTGQPQAFLVTPVPQIISNGNLSQANTAASTFSYQLANSYVINEQGNIVSTLTNAQHAPFTFNRI